MSSTTTSATDTTTRTGFEVRPLDAPLGAEIVGFDLTGQPSGDDLFALLEAFRAYHLLVFRGTPLTDPQLLEVASWFGPQYVPPAGIPVFGTDEQGAVASLSNRKGRGIGSRIPLPYHSDFQYMPVPLLGAVLHSIEVPPEGGDTYWSNLHLAYDELDDGLKARLDGVMGIGVNPWAGEGLGKDWAGEDQLYTDGDVPDFPHPLVRTHPETGRRSLYFSSFITKLEGLRAADGSGEASAAEAQELIDQLNAHVEQDRFAYRHTWRVGDTMIWDNRNTNHKRDDFDQQYPREMHRVQIAGTKPF